MTLTEKEEKGVAAQQLRPLRPLLVRTRAPRLGEGGGKGGKKSVEKLVQRLWISLRITVTSVITELLLPLLPLLPSGMINFVTQCVRTPGMRT